MHDTNLMKVLIGLGIVQTAMLIFVGMRVVSIEQHSAMASLESQLARERAAPAARAANASVMSVLDAHDVREIVREELADVKSDLTRIANTDRGGSVTRSAPPPRVDPVGAAEMEAAFDRDLNLYIGRGVINEAEMAALQSKLAKLPPTQRSEALVKLNRAINNNLLEGQL